MNSKFQFLEVERTGPVTVVWLNRTDKLNALSVELMREIEEVARSFLNDETTRVVAFRGRGKHFSAGADLKPDRPPALEPLVMRRRDSALGARMIRAILEIDQVTIAGIPVSYTHLTLPTKA